MNEAIKLVLAFFQHFRRIAKRHVDLGIIAVRAGGFNVGSEVEIIVKYFLDTDSDFT